MTSLSSGKPQGPESSELPNDICHGVEVRTSITGFGFTIICRFEGSSSLVSAVSVTCPCTCSLQKAWLCVCVCVLFKIAPVPPTLTRRKVLESDLSCQCDLATLLLRHLLLARIADALGLLFGVHVYEYGERKSPRNCHKQPAQAYP